MQAGTLTLHNVIEQVSKEKGIDPKILIDATEQAILTAAKRSFGLNRELEARFNAETGFVDLFQYMTVVESVENPEREISVEEAKEHNLEASPGEELGFQIFYMDEHSEQAKKQDKEFGELLQLQQHRRGFGRIAAQTAKQVILQRVRDAERDIIFNEFKDRKGEIITGIVRRFERGNNIVVDLARTEAILPSREQTPRESYRPGDRIVAFVKDIDREARGPMIILSRTDVGLLIKLFEMEVPEIYEGIVRIVAAAREPGARSKIAVSSRDSDVDPVGACVGMKGSRVQAVVQELRGEKIDIVPWDRDPARFVCNAIAPAEVSRVIIDENSGAMELVVPDEKLSLAIGRRGQNVRLATQLTGWRLDIIGESKFRQIEEDALTSLGRIEGIDEHVAKNMYKAGFRTLDEVIEASENELGAIPGLGGPTNAAKIKELAERAMEEHRVTRVREASERSDVMSDRDKLLLMRGVGERTAQMLDAAGFRTPEDVAREEDVDKMAIKSGLGIRKARAVKEAAQAFLANDWPGIDAGQRVARARAEAEAAKVAAAAAEAAAEAAAATAAAEAAAAIATPEATPSGGGTEA